MQLRYGGALSKGWPDMGLAGYLLFRVSRGRHPRRATIIHLCVDEGHRGQGVARLLVDALKVETRDLDGIRLSCRRDYEANALWPRLGFELLGERPGRGKDAAVLGVWWFSHGSPLLCRMWEIVSEQTVVAALDANVVFDLGSDADPAAESQALMSDWIFEHVQFVVTRELSNEIGRKQDAVDRSRSRALAARFPVLAGSADTFESAHAQLEGVLGRPKGESEASDIRELAWAAAGGVDYFVSRDQRLLDQAAEIEECLELTVVRPSTLVAEFDELVNGSAYQPRRFEGSRLSLQPADPRAELRLAEAYLDFASGEKKAPFVNILRSSLASRPGEVREVVGPRGQPLVLYQVMHSGVVVDLPLLRVARARIAPTLLRHLLATLVTSSRGAVLRVSDVHVSTAVERALVDMHFVRDGSMWIKPCPDHVGPAEGVTRPLSTLCSAAGIAEVAEHIEASISTGQRDLFALERMLHPAKFTNLELPCYIIPIRANWAAQLFETRLAEQDLFGLPPELGFRLENVYYSAALRGFETPARLIWYVSKANATHAGAGAVRAVSYLDEVSRDTPKALFSRFRRLGVYRWQNLMELTKRSTSATITALKFSGTELLSRPVSWPDLQVGLERHMGRGNQLQGPVQITSELFFELYSVATASP